MAKKCHGTKSSKAMNMKKGKFVVLKEEDFTRVDVEATQMVDIINFVEIDEVDPLLFYSLSRKALTRFELGCLSDLPRSTYRT